MLEKRTGGKDSVGMTARITASRLSRNMVGRLNAIRGWTVVLWRARYPLGDEELGAIVCHHGDREILA